MDRSASAVILLSTFNGSRYVKEQIFSLKSQGCHEWTLLIRDDGSTDDTVSIIKDEASRDSRIQILNDSFGRMGFVQSFGLLMKEALNYPSKIFFLCDQDDIWDRHKMETMSKRLFDKEAGCGSHVPILVHSDLRVTNEHLIKKASSFMKYQGISHEESNPLRVLLVQNFVTGCASAFNRRALEVAVPVPPDVISHDWWLALCTSVTGEIDFIPTSLLSYRQHHHNAIGALSYWSRFPVSPFKLVNRWRRGKRILQKSIGQVCRLRERIEQHPSLKSEHTSAMIDAYLLCQNKGFFFKLATVNHFGIRRQRTIPHLLYLLHLLFN